MVHRNDGAESSGPFRMEREEAKAGRPDRRYWASFQERLESFESAENFLGERGGNSAGAAARARAINFSICSFELPSGMAGPHGSSMPRASCQKDMDAPYRRFFSH